MQTSQLHGLFIGCFQVEIHHLFLQGASLGCDALIKQELILYLRHGTAFNGCGMGNKRIEIELLVVYLLGDAQRMMLFK